MSGGTATPFLAARAATTGAAQQGLIKATLSKLGNYANKAISYLPKGKTFASQLARQGIIGGTIGATEGALSAKTGERGAGAVQGGIFGSGFGMGLSTIGKGLGAGYDKLVRKYFNPSEVATAPMSKPKKIAVEKLIYNISHSSDLNFISLRYFNVSGSNYKSNIGEAHYPETHIIPLALQAALKNNYFKINGK